MNRDSERKIKKEQQQQYQQQQEHLQRLFSPILLEWRNEANRTRFHRHFDVAAVNLLLTYPNLLIRIVFGFPDLFPVGEKVG